MWFLEGTSGVLQDPLKIFHSLGMLSYGGDFEHKVICGQIFFETRIVINRSQP